ncbi:MAG: glycosyltransferase [Alphaproteobacteria bacterium]|nr:glycosyltransferase [Alphaproteobacteria bacterium]
MPKISVIVPIYNREETISRCLESIILQKLSDIEIICVNDGSTDKTETVLEEFAKKDKRVKVIKQANQGPSIARNNGMKAAIGEYIGFVDCDDYIEPDFYEKLYQAAKEEDADVALASILYDAKKKKYFLLDYKKRKIATTISSIFKLIGLPQTPYVWNKIYLRKFLIDNQLYFKEHFYYEDIVFSTQMASLCRKAIYVPGTKYHYTYNENSVVATVEEKPEIKQNRYDAFSFYNSFVRKKGLKVPYKYQYEKRVKILGLPVIKIKGIGDSVKAYYVFGLLVIKVKSTQFF